MGYEILIVQSVLGLYVCDQVELMEVWKIGVLYELGVFDGVDGVCCGECVECGSECLVIDCVDCYCQFCFGCCCYQCC